MRRGAHAGGLVDVLVGQRNAQAAACACPAITARSAARAAASACRSVTSRKALSCGSLASIRASSSFTSSTGDSRFAAIRRLASAMVRKGGVGPVIARDGQSCGAQPWRLRRFGAALALAFTFAFALAFGLTLGFAAGRTGGMDTTAPAGGGSRNT